MRSNYIFTSESVSEGHPDKVADQISDAIVDLFIGKDSEARVACETLVTTNRIEVGGEIRCGCQGVRHRHHSSCEGPSWGFASWPPASSPAHSRLRRHRTSLKHSTPL